MKKIDTKIIEPLKNQENSIIDTKAVLASKQDVLMAIGQVQAFNNIRKYATVAEIITYRKIKESKQFKGLIYIDDNGKSATVADLEDICKYFFKRSYRAMQQDEQNLEAFGQEFLESAQAMQLGYRELAKLRQLPSEEQALIINNEAVDLGDKEAVKELIEDYTFSHLTEKAALKKQIDEANQTVEAVRENSAQKQQELDEVKEREAKRRFSQAPWERQTLDSVTGMLQAKTLIEQGINQLSDIYQNVINDESVEEKALDLIIRCLLSETQAAQVLTSKFSNDIFGIFADKYRPDILAADTFFDLQTNDETPE